MYKFVCLEEGYKDQGVERETFAAAFADMHRYVRKFVDSGACALQVLETCHWIETPVNIPMFWYDARDRAYDEGIMKDGKLVEEQS